MNTDDMNERTGAPYPVRDGSGYTRGVEMEDKGFARTKRVLVVGSITIAAAVVIVFVLLFSPLLRVTHITFSSTEHLTKETLGALITLPSDATLFRVDDEAIASAVKANSWVSEVVVERVFPNTLHIEVTERECIAIAMMASGQEAWRISSDGHWIEAIPMQEGSAEAGVATPVAQARAVATAEDLVFIKNLPPIDEPVAGSMVSDEVVASALAYLNGFSSTLVSRIDTIKAPNREGLALVLDDGVEIAVGAPTNIVLKEQVIAGLEAQYPGQITYINVRTPSSPSWRGLDAVTEVDTTDQEYVAPVEPTEPTVTDTAQESDTTAQVLLPNDADGGPGGFYDEGGYVRDDGKWMYNYHDKDGNYFYGYYDDAGNYVNLA